MNTKITAHQFDLNENLHAYVNNKLTVAIRHLIDDPATQLEVTLSLQDSSHDDEKATCVANLVMPRLQPIVVQKSGPSIYAAIDSVHDTLFECVARTVERRQDKHARRQASAKHRDDVARQELTADVDGPIEQDPV